MDDRQLPHYHGEEPTHTDVIRQLLDRADTFQRLADIFRQLGDANRIRIFWLLCHCEECVVNIAAMMDMSSPAVSHHLRTLRDSGLLMTRRDGKEVYYRAPDTVQGQLLHEIVEQVMEIACPEKSVDRSASQEEIIRNVHDYMVEHLSERLTIEALSREFLMNTTTLKAVFKKVYGTSLAAHMKAHRMERAASLLLKTQDDIGAIARAVGYESQSRFTSAFRECYGVSPGEYRRAHTPA